jgi:hypothetical protein
MFTGPTTQREKRSFVWERKIFKFYYWSMPQWMNEWEDNISFVVLSCGLRETSRVEDYTDFEEERLRKVCECFPSPPGHHRERRNFFLERNKKWNGY